MGKKNFLKIIRELDANNTAADDADDVDDDIIEFNSAEEYCSHPGHGWDAWVCNGDKDNADDWIQECGGTLDECLQAVTNWITVEVDLNEPPIEPPGVELESKEYGARWEWRQSQKRNEIRRQCMTTGSFKSPGSKYSPPWEIRCADGPWDVGDAEINCS